MSTVPRPSRAGGNGTSRRPSRAGGNGRPAAPVRIVHLGLGNFVRAHGCWYTEHAPDAEAWGIAAFTGRGSVRLCGDLEAQQGLYTLVTRSAAQDSFELVASLSRAHAAGEHEAWLRYFAAPELALVTLTVTEAGYLRRAGGGVDLSHPQLEADIAMLRADLRGHVVTAPARLVAGFAARRRASGGPLALVPCDNLPDNGAIAFGVVRELADEIDPALAAWISESVSRVTTVVDRVTPRSTEDDVREVRRRTGRDDRCPVVTEPYCEWVLSGSFPAGRPDWGGARVVGDVRPFEQRKLLLLNGGHSLLAYAGSIAGHETVAEALADERCRDWLDEWWELATPRPELPAGAVAASRSGHRTGPAGYRDVLLERWSNPRIRHQLAQIAADGSQKLPIRVLPVLRAQRSAGRLPAGATRTLAAWVCHLRGLGAPVSDVRAIEYRALAAGRLREGVVRVLERLDPALGADQEVIALTDDQAQEMQGLWR